MQATGRFFSAKNLNFLLSWSISIVGGVRAMSAMTSSARIAVGQLCSTDSKMKSLLDAATCARRAKKDGATMLFLPENFGFMGSSPQEAIQQAESPSSEAKNSIAITQRISNAIDQTSGTLTEPMDVASFDDNDSISLLDGLKTIASASGLWISACIHTLGAPPTSDGMKRIYNTHFILDDAGSIQATYNKIHLFDVSIPGQVELRESNSTAPGTQVVVCDSPIGKLGLSTCYDVRFPQLYTEMVQRGAEIILIPAAFTVTTGTAHWHILLRARAIETQCYVVAAAQFGTHNSKRQSYGHSLVVDPWGVVLADAGGVDSLENVGDGPTIVCCDVDLTSLHQIRQRMPVQQHRSNANYK